MQSWCEGDRTKRRVTPIRPYYNPLLTEQDHDTLLDGRSSDEKNCLTPEMGRLDKPRKPWDKPPVTPNEPRQVKEEFYESHIVHNRLYHIHDVAIPPFSALSSLPKQPSSKNLPVPTQTRRTSQLPHSFFAQGRETELK